MKKFSTIFFTIYNLFLVIVAIFNLFNFSPTALRVLLGLTALQVAFYKFTDYLAEVDKKWPPITIVTHVARNSKEVHDEFRNEVRLNLVKGLTMQLLNQELIEFEETESPDGNDSVITKATIYVIKKDDLNNN